MIPLPQNLLGKRPLGRRRTPRFNPAPIRQPKAPIPPLFLGHLLQHEKEVVDVRLFRLALFGLEVVGYSTEMEPHHGANLIWSLLGDSMVREPVESAKDARFLFVPGMVTELHQGDGSAVVWTEELAVLGEAFDLERYTLELRGEGLAAPWKKNQQ